MQKQQTCHGCGASINFQVNRCEYCGRHHNSLFVSQNNSHTSSSSYSDLIGKFSCGGIVSNDYGCDYKVKSIIGLPMSPKFTSPSLRLSR